MSSAKRGKGRSIVQPGQTLHHFFKATPHRQKPNTNSSSRVSISQEIIVIDSDNDEDVEILEYTKPVKRRRLSADAHPNPNLDKSLSHIIPLNAESQPSPVEFSDSGENKFSTTSENKPVLSFGSPVLLLSNTCLKPSYKEPVQSYSFGQPSALLQGSPVKKKDAGHSEHPFGVVNHVSEETGPSSSKIDDVDIDLTLEDWENGDNEQPFEFKTEDDWMIPRNANNVSCVGALRAFDIAHSRQLLGNVKPRY